MSKVEKLDLIGVSSLAAVTAALLVGWMVTTHEAIAKPARGAAHGNAVTLSNDGAMKLTVTASLDRPHQYTATARSTSASSMAGPALEVALPYALRP